MKIEETLKIAKERYGELVRSRGLMDDDVKLLRALITKLEKTHNTLGYAMDIIVDRHASLRVIKNNVDVDIDQIERFRSYYSEALSDT